jgi:hypothetical protein
MGKAVVIEDDFCLGQDPDTPLANWVEVDDGGTGTNAFTTATAGGSVNIVTAGADNDYHALRSASYPIDFLSAKAIWFEARFRLAEATTNDSAWWFGLTNTLTTGGFLANSAGPLANYDGAMIWKDEDTMQIQAETSNAAAKDTEATVATFVSNTWTKVGFYVSGAATTGVMTAYYNVAGTSALTAHGTTMNITRAGCVPMCVVFGVKAGPGGAAETLEVDYVKCVQALGR